MEKQITISVAKDFSRCPGGRYKTDGPHSAESLRDDILIPSLKDDYAITLELDGVMGYPASFLEEVFGGLVRKGYTPLELDKLITVKTEDFELLKEVWNYILDSFADGFTVV